MLALAIAMLAVAVLALFVPATLEVLAFMWIPIIVSIAFAGPRETALLSLWGGALAVTVGGVTSHYDEPFYWIRQATMVLMALFAIYLSAVISKQRQRIEEFALTDPLTGLANRRLVIERIGFLLRQRERDAAVAVLYIDLDGFKAVNTRFGHAAGDDVLKEVGGRLSGAMRAGDTVARFGGDEFLVICPSLNTDHDAERICLRVQEILAEPLSTPVTVGATIGAVIIGPDQDVLPTDAIDQADQLLMELKASRQANYQIQCVSGSANTAS